MLHPDSFHTITATSEGIFRDRGSRFMAYAFPVSSEEQIKQYLNGLRREHPSARHHCYAWRLGPLNETSRANDDGEPPNSAGKPIMAQIQAAGLYQVLVVVVRYFGGTLLGVNGLINAYKNAAADAIANATVEERFLMSEYTAHFEATDLGAVMRILKETGSRIVSNDYDTEHKIVFKIRMQLSAQLEKRFEELYKVRLELTA